MTKKSTSFIENKSQLIKYFSDGIKKDTNLRIGVEHEKFLFNRNDLKRIDYKKLKQVFEILKNKGWNPEYEGDKIIGLKRDDQKITTEPGFQYELSGAPYKNIHSVCSENSSHFNELKEVLNSVWSIAFADGEMDKHEEHLIRRIADLLYLNHKDFINAKLNQKETNENS